MTLIINNVKKLTQILNKNQKTIKFVPTLGNLHGGHKKLICESQKITGISVVSIFINPLQFDNKFDFQSYPKTLIQDIRHIKNLNVDILFAPNESFSKDIELKNSHQYKKLIGVLCGKNRPGHFEGVIMILSKFLNIIKPDYLFLGEKDYQQTIIVKKLIKNMILKTKIKLIKTQRMQSGLAMSSRNCLLSSTGQLHAANLFKTMKNIKRNIKKFGLLKTKLKYYKNLLINSGFEKVNYLEIRKENDLSEITSKPEKARIFISANIEKIRLIDNLFVGKVKIQDKYFTNS